MGQNMGQFALFWCGSQTVRGTSDEKLLTLMRAGAMSIYSLPLLKSKRKFRLTAHNACPP